MRRRCLRLLPFLRRVFAIGIHHAQTGVLAIDVSTLEAADEGFWEGVERHTKGSTLLVRACFGRGSVVALARWVVEPNGADQGRRLATVSTKTLLIVYSPPAPLQYTKTQ